MMQEYKGKSGCVCSQEWKEISSKQYCKSIVKLPLDIVYMAT